jgi:hypothetical protein
MAVQEVNVRKLLSHLGGITETHAILEKSGVVVKRSAVAKWQERNRIPGNHLTQLVLLKKLDLKKFT